MDTSRWLRLCRADTIPEGKYRVIDTDGLGVVVVNCGGRLAVFKNHCSHQGRRMEGGALESTTFTCPHHAVSYDVFTGAVVNFSGFLDVAPVIIYHTEVRDGDLFIDLSPRPGAEVPAAQS